MVHCGSVLLSIRTADVKKSEEHSAPAIRQEQSFASFLLELDERTILYYTALF